MKKWTKILEKKGKTSTIIDTNIITTATFEKKLRNKLNFSQTLFAKILGVSVKTIEKWEQGTNPIQGAASRLLYLLDRNPKLIDQLYLITDFDEVKNNEYRITFENFDSDEEIRSISNISFEVVQEQKTQVLYADRCMLEKNNSLSYTS